MSADLGQPVATTSQLPPGTLRGVVVSGDPVLIANVGGEYLAVSGQCTHDGAPLEDGELEAETVVCPWHFSKFCLRTGAVINDPAREPLRMHRVTVVDDTIHVS
jgi:3-phenylpropionate/trans-cinnamate dioxygenase ferredoxin subunit